MSKLALGTVQFGLDYGVSNPAGQTPAGEVADLLAKAAAGGVEMLDTAPAYGTAETVLGAAGTSGFQVVSKLPKSTPADAVSKTLSQSLLALRREAVEGYIVHDPADLLGPDCAAVWAALEDARAAGYARRIGASVSSPQDVDALMARYPLDLVQLPLNPIDARWQAQGTLTALAQAGVEVHARSVFLQGLLLMQNPPPALRAWTPLLGAFQDWCAQRGKTPAQACLGHVLAQPGIAKAVIGVTNRQELSQALDIVPDPEPVPEHLRCVDPDLLNPARWTT
ncbi:MAG: aldo/keto reductase [Tateyamaria sp.]|uniref:aldo/keto reductase n=1 Tax=Tateyamaria sp. TaxID=1929288 RepID=UPI00328E899F